jgi:hypothetical protein
MPPELQESFEAIKPHIFWKIPEKSFNLKLKVTFNGKSKPEHVDEWRIEEFPTFKDYYNALQKIILDLEGWLNKNLPDPSNLNT